MADMKNFRELLGYPDAKSAWDKTKPLLPQFSQVDSIIDRLRNDVVAADKFLGEELSKVVMIAAAWFDDIPPTSLKDIQNTRDHLTGLTEPQHKQLGEELTTVAVGYLGLARVLHVRLNREFKDRNVAQYQSATEIPEDLANYFVVIAQLEYLYRMLEIENLPQKTITGADIHWWAETQQDFAATAVAAGKKETAKKILENAARRLRKSQDDSEKEVEVKLSEVLQLPIGDRSALAVVWARLGRIMKSADLVGKGYELELENSKTQLNEDRLKTLWNWAKQAFFNPVEFTRSSTGTVNLLKNIVRYLFVVAENKQRQ